MDEMSEKTLNTAEEQPTPKKKSRKALVIILCIAALLLLLVVGVIAVPFIYFDNMVGLISFEDSSEISWDGVNIDDPSYGFYTSDDEVPGGGGVSDWSNFVDPELSRDDWSGVDIDDPNYTGDSGNGGNGSGGGSNIDYDLFVPDFTMIEGLFDDNIITDTDEKDVVNILLIGADTLSGKHARSDTMILMSINNVKKRIVFTSLMRDTYVSIPGYKNNRLNAAFAAGGPTLLMKTIKQNFDITVDYYFMVSIASFESAVDAIGGIDLTINEDNYDYFKTHEDIKWLTKSVALDGTHTVHLNGARALAYARSRAFSNGDFTRTLHQRDLLTQFVNNCKGCTLEEMHSLLKAVLPYVATSMPKSKLKAMVWDVLRYLSYSVTDARVPCPGGYEYANINGREVLAINFKKNTEYLKAKIYS